ncbi:MAG: MotA/TolQ/ExbB proton channel family protein [Lentisphaerota bacterium]
MKTNKYLAIMLLALLTLYPLRVLAQTPAPTPASADAAAEPAAKKMTLWGLIVVGGWAMWPLGLCSFGLIMMVAVNFRQVNAKKLMPDAVIAPMKAAAKQQDLQKVWDLSQGTPCLFSRAIAAGIRRFDPDHPEACKSAMEEAISESVTRDESQLSYWINFLSLITAISPMLGLLGTVSGMIGAFQKIAGGGMGKPELLAGNIGEALITTAAGLVIAIPAMFFYFMFRNLLNRILQQAEESFSVILEDLTGTGMSRLFEDESSKEKSTQA